MARAGFAALIPALMLTLSTGCPNSVQPSPKPTKSTKPASKASPSPQPKTSPSPSPRTSPSPTGSTSPSPSPSASAATSPSPSASVSSSPVASASIAPNTVVMKNMAFSPATLRVATGTVVTFVNQEATMTHQVTPDASPALFTETGVINPGSSATITFATVGQARYKCKLHATMTGTIDVVPAASASIKP